MAGCAREEYCAPQSSLNVEELNSVVQRTIDRILFLRICEDRGIEEYETLQKLLEGEQVYDRLCQLFRYADDKYNSGLFHFQQEPDWDESPDTLSLTVAIDDKVLKGIIKRLYLPGEPVSSSRLSLPLFSAMCTSSSSAR